MSGAVTPGVVTFVYATWWARYPELGAWVGPAQAQQYFNEACLYLDNTGCSRVQDASPGGARATILNMLTAHLAKLNAPINDEPPSGLVGRVASAGEGSVSVSTDFAVPGTAAWYAQTPYGASAWQALAPYRMACYVPSWRSARLRGGYGGSPWL